MYMHGATNEERMLFALREAGSAGLTTSQLRIVVPSWPHLKRIRAELIELQIAEHVVVHTGYRGAPRKVLRRRGLS